MARSLIKTAPVRGATEPSAALIGAPDGCRDSRAAAEPAAGWSRQQPRAEPGAGPGDSFYATRPTADRVPRITPSASPELPEA